MKRFVLFGFLFLCAMALLCSTALADETVGDVLRYGEGDFAVEFRTADGTAVAENANGEYPGAVRLTMTYQGKAVPGSQYLVLVVDGSSRTDRYHIRYIDQKKAEGTDVSFDVYPMPMKDGEQYFVRLIGDDGSFSSLHSVVTFTYYNHVPGEPVRENEVPATCAGAGSYDEVVYCAECGEELSRVTNSIPKVDHSFRWVVTKEPTETEPGVRSYECEMCGTVEKTQPFPNKGDLNVNGRRDDMDLILLLQCIHGTQGPEVLLSRADINGDNGIDYNDLHELILTVRGEVSPDIAALFLKNGYSFEAMFVLQYAAGLRSAFPDMIPVPVPALDAAPETDTDEALPEEEPAAEPKTETEAEPIPDEAPAPEPVPDEEPAPDTASDEAASDGPEASLT